MNNPLSVKNDFKNKHIVLKKLFDKWRVGEERTNGGFTVTEHGRCLSILELMSNTNLSKTNVDLIVISLSNKNKYFIAHLFLFLLFIISILLILKI